MGKIVMINKKISYTIIIFLLFISGCNYNSKKAEEIADIYKNDNDYLFNSKSDIPYNSEILSSTVKIDWLEEEHNYINDMTENNKGIVQLSDSFYASEKELYISASDLTLCISNLTGDYLNICPDPLCPHTPESQCQYLDLWNFMFDADNPSVFYCVKHTWDYDNGILESPVCRIDTTKRDIDVIYDTKRKNDNAFHYDVRLYKVINGSLIFSETRKVKKQDDEGNQIIISYGTLFSYNIIDGKISILNDHWKGSDEWLFLGAGNKFIYFFDIIDHNVCACEYGTDIINVVANLGKEYTFQSAAYDSHNEKLYVTVNLNNLYNRTQEEIESLRLDGITGYILSVSKDLECEILDMPSNDIIRAWLTDEYIYYTVLDPVYYGKDNYGRTIADWQGNKLYRVKKDDLGTAELIFDGHDELLFTEYCVSGENLYLLYCTARQDAGIRAMGTVARVNFTENTIKWIK